MLLNQKYFLKNFGLVSSFNNKNKGYYDAEDLSGFNFLGLSFTIFDLIPTGRANYEIIMVIDSSDLQKSIVIEIYEYLLMT